MAGPIELMIVAAAFGIVGAYLYIVSRFIRAAEVKAMDAEQNSQAMPTQPRAQRLNAQKVVSVH